jgi:hypothetical protein
VQDQLNVLQPVQEAGVNDVHQMREIESAVDALCPATVATEELAGAAVSQEPFDWSLKIHDLSFPESEPNRNGVKNLNLPVAVKCREDFVWSGGR